MATPDTAQDSKNLVERATRRMDNAIARARKTGTVRDLLPEFMAAEADFRIAWQILAAADRSQAVLPLVRSADCLRISQEWDAAQTRYEKGLTLARETGNKELEAKAWFGIEKIQRIGRVNQGAAAAAGAHALRLSREVKLDKLELDILSELADVESAGGNLVKAQKTFEDVINRSRELGEKEILQSALFGKSQMLHSKAESLVDQFSNLKHTTKQEWLSCDAVAKSARNALSDAATMLVESAALARELGFDFLASAASQELHMIAQLEESFERTYAVKKQAHLEKVRDSTTGRSQPTLGSASPIPELAAESRSVLTQNCPLIETNLYGPALPGRDIEESKAFANALRQELKTFVSSPGTLWRHRLMEGRVAETDGDIDAALRSYTDAARLVEQQRATFSDDAARTAFLAQAVDLFDRLALMHLARNSAADALEWLERSRARATADLLATGLRLPSETERRLHAELLQTRSTADVESETVLLNKIRSEAPQLLELVESEPVSLSEVRGAMKESPFDLIYYILYQGRIIAWHVGPEQTHLRAWFGPLSELQRLSVAFRKSLSDRAARFHTGAAKDLYFLLVQPILDWIATKRLVIVLPPELQGVSFQAMLDERDGKFLGEKIALSYAPSATVAVRLRPTPSLAGAKVFGLVGPGLPEGNKDMAVLAKHYGEVEVVEGRAATRASLLRIAAGKNLVHLAAHGKYDASSPMLSHIKIRSGSGEDEPLTAADMFELPLRSAWLVTLAACEAAQVQSQATNELYGLIRALLYAGAQSLLLPLWRVDTHVASHWLDIFYREAKTHRLPDALLIANQEIRRHPIYGADPRLWASFILIGR